MTRVLLLLLFCLTGTALLAVEPDEMLADPVLEARARALDQVIRCVKCRSENIASSSASWARDVRILVREKIRLGSTDQEVLDFLVARYGEYVLMKPTFSGGNTVLWVTAPVGLLLGFAVVFLFIRQRSRAPLAQSDLSAEEQARLEALLKE